jgi:hypothetical protein
MQCPPTPGPGVNFMKPNGFVAAASMTSQTSRPIRSQRSASWLTKAMLMFRKTFSRSLAISAASGDVSSTTVSLMFRSRAAARVVAAGVEPPTRRGTSFPELAGSPGLTRSGAKARSKSAPARRPVSRSRTARNGPVVVPGKVVDWRTTRCPARRPARTSSAAERTGPRSGSLVGVTGVGTQTNTASAARMASGSGATARKPATRAAARRASGMSSMGELPRVSSSIRAGLASIPVTARPASTNPRASGSPTYPSPMTAMDRSSSTTPPVA